MKLLIAANSDTGVEKDVVFVEADERIARWMLELAQLLDRHNLVEVRRSSAAALFRWQHLRERDPGSAACESRVADVGHIALPADFYVPEDLPHVPLLDDGMIEFVDCDGNVLDLKRPVENGYNNWYERVTASIRWPEKAMPDKPYRKFHELRCPECRSDLTISHNVTLELVVVGRPLTVPTCLLPGSGELVDVDGLVAQGHHAGSYCFHCLTLLEEVPVARDQDVRRLYPWRMVPT